MSWSQFVKGTSIIFNGLLWLIEKVARVFDTSDSEVPGVMTILWRLMLEFPQPFLGVLLALSIFASIFGLIVFRIIPRTRRGLTLMLAIILLMAVLSISWINEWMFGILF